MNLTLGRKQYRLALLPGAMFLVLGICMSAQVNTETNTTSAPSTHEITVERGEVILVRGNDLFVKMDDGSTRHFPNVPESARVTVGDQQFGIHDLKPGMKLMRTTIVTTTPKTVTTVQTVTGKVWHVSPPNSVILTLEDGSNQQFKIPKDQKFNVDGQETDAFGLKKGMKVSATKIVEVPVVSVTQSQQVSGKLPPPPPPVAQPAADMPILIASRGPEPVAAELPKTGSLLPLIGLLGTLSFLSALAMGVIRKCF
jgi:hypothetical protein